MLKVWLAIGLVFIAGFVAGSVTTRAMTRRTIARIVNNPDQLHVLIGNRLERRLRLNADQRERVDIILTRTQGDLRRLREQFAPSFQNIMSNTEVEISSVLTSEQRVRFERFKEEHRGLWPRK